MKTLLCTLLVAGTIAVATPALALEHRPTDRPAKVKPTVQAVAKARLSEAKLQSCQKREQAITARSNQLVKFTTNHIEVFERITSRVQNFYTNKVVSKGKTVSNYDALVADIATKKSSVQSALAKAQTTASAFSCGGEDPKGQLQQFRLDMQATKSALQEYRKAVRNLIVAVHTAARETRPSASPTP